jgi:hypothetical protein
MDDRVSIIKYYGAKKVQDKVAQSPWLSEQAFSFLSGYFSIPKEDLACYTNRKSEDLEFFCSPFKEMNLLKIEPEIEKVFPGSKSFSESRISMAFYINEITVDFVYYHYKNIRDEIIEENIRMFSINELLDHSDYGHYLRSLTYFEDAEKSLGPKILNHLSRKQVKANVQKAGLDFFSQKTNENK